MKQSREDHIPVSIQFSRLADRNPPGLAGRSELVARTGHAPLNAVAPGVVETPMTAAFTGSKEARESILTMVPMPLNGIFEPRDAAYLLAWLTSEENAHLCGQVVFIDGGSDAVIRGDSTW